MGIERELADEIVAKHYEDVYIFCRARLRDTETAQDITQETFLTFLKKSGRLEPDHILSWLLKTADYKILGYLKKKGAGPRFEELDDADCAVLDDTFFADAGIDEQELYTEVLKKILSVLDEDERRLFIALYIQKRDIKAFAEEMNTTEGNIRVRKTRIKKKVREKYKYYSIFL